MKDHIGDINKMMVESEPAKPSSLQQPCSVAWTKTPPATAGHYWVRFGRGDKHTMTVLEVENWHGKMQCYYYQTWRPLDDSKYWYDVEWWPTAITPPLNAKLCGGGEQSETQPR